MKIPVSKLKSEELEALFQKSSIVEHSFFPKQVPSLPHWDSPPKKSEDIVKGGLYEKAMEKN